MTLKISKYLIDCAISEKSTVLYSTLSEKTLLINKDVLNDVKLLDFEKISNELLNKLKEYGFLVPLNLDETAFVLSTNKQKIEDSKTLHFVLMATGLCQLGCFYCGQNHTNTYFTEETQSKILENIDTDLSSKSYNHSEMGWFGAEPLLAMDTMKKMHLKVLEICDKHSVTYSGGGMPSNGFELTVDRFVELEKLGITDIDVTWMA